MSDRSSEPVETVVVLNPVSGDEHHDELRSRARERGFRVVETAESGDARQLASEAFDDGAGRVVAAGGDGTVNGVVQGLVDVNALDDVTFGVLPAGTGNDFAENVGITDLDSAFDALDAGSVRHIDLGVAGDRIFVTSCVGGLTAEASGRTSSEMKSRYGVFAYVLETLRTLADFEGMALSARASPTAEGVDEWTGEAVFVLIGNARRFPLEGSVQTNVEDGLLDVLIIERLPTSMLLQEAAMEQLFGRESDGIVRMQTPTLELSSQDVQSPSQDVESLSFSLDGEMESRKRLTVTVRGGALPIHVGDAYEVPSSGS